MQDRYSTSGRRHDLTPRKSRRVDLGDFRVAQGDYITAGLRIDAADKTFRRIK
jgi:hypothetical protein